MCKFIVITISSSRSTIIQKPLEVSFWERKIKLGVGNSIIVSVSKDGHFQKHCTVEVGVVLPLLHMAIIIQGLRSHMYRSKSACGCVSA